MKRDRPVGPDASHPDWEDTQPMSRLGAAAPRQAGVQLGSARRAASLFGREIEGLEVSELDSATVFDQHFGDKPRV